MFAQQTAAAVRSALLALGLIVLAGSAQAQQPSAAAVAMAKELIALKGATTMYDPVVRGVIEQAKSVLLRTNPMLSKELERGRRQAARRIRAADRRSCGKSWRASTRHGSPSRSSRTRSPSTRRRSARS